jgi:serine/threonine protein kinase
MTMTNTATISANSTASVRGNEAFNEYGAYEKKQYLLKDKYKFITPIQEGAFGKVTLAVNVQTKEKVAMKAMYKSHENTRRIANHEIDVLSKIGRNNDNICQLLDHFETSEFIILILEYCSNGDLYDLIHSSINISAVDIWNIAKELANALKYAHSLGIYHRDIKPENVLFNCFGRVKLCDWGLATTKRMNREFSVGTEKYMAPEVFIEKPELTEYDCKYVDYWSFGITLITAIFGTCPFKPVGESSNIHSDYNFKKFVYYGNSQILYDIYPTMNETCFNIFMNLLRIGGNEDNLLEFNDKINSRNLDNFIQDLQDNWKFGLTIDEEYELEQFDDDAESDNSNDLFNMDHDDLSSESQDEQLSFDTSVESESDSDEYLTNYDTSMKIRMNQESDHHNVIPSLIESSIQSLSSKSWCDLDDDEEFNQIFNAMSLNRTKKPQLDIVKDDFTKSNLGNDDIDILKVEWNLYNNNHQAYN